ncbi:SusC/RagA family TonB-linked outer membrane protein [Fodinibius halophilus]|uniref:TonB-dependent receptor n=1 Tax=Fodinibius halophilus TaxID=1736908 RepID=A0A6M1TED6_9BACT|nr:TonB-dependent receptor [Fodinibius halophilus]NGP87040.1 TonB-dependent receptor [Fodinibius halophilus]
MIPLKKLLITSCLILGLALPGLAQITVSGTVTDAETQEVLPGVNVTVNGMSTRGTSTDLDGTYSLEVPSAQDTLTFSFVGYIKQEIPLNGRSTINIELSPDIQQLQDVVVIGYGTQEKDDNTGSVTAVSAEDFNEGAITSPEELFQGKAAGVTVTSNDGAPGSGATIRIRGGSSLSADNAPLYVVDGIPLDGGNVSGMRNPLNTINPNDIESISILKDASATAIYGSRASNGVVLITTKRGEAGQNFEISYTGKASYHTQSNEIDVLSADEFSNTIQTQFGQTGAQYLGDNNTDWQEQIYSNSFSQDHNLSFSGAYNSLPYRVSIGFSGNSGLLKTSDMDRFTGSIAVNPTFFDDALKVDLNLKGMQVKNRFANQGAIGSALTFDPTQPVTVDGNPYGDYFTWTKNNSPIELAPANPLALLEQTNNASTVYRSIGNIKLDYALPFVENLNAVVKAGYDYSTVEDGKNNIKANAAFAYQGPNGANGQRIDYSQKKENELLDFYLNYKKELESIDSKVDLTAGYSWEHHYEEGATYATNYNTSDTLAVSQDTDYKTEHYIVSFFGRANYTFKDKYLLTATLRQDGTSRFSEDNRWGLFPSAALAWKIHEESFLEDIEAINQLKLRLGYGITGQQRINRGNYPYLPKYTLSEPTAQYQFGDQFIKTFRPEGYNANLKWEETTTYNIGLDYGLFDDRVFGSIEAYYRKTNDLLNFVPVPAGTNFTNRILSNIGSMEVKGAEFNVTGRVISTEDTYWEVGFNASRNLDEITQLTNVNSEDYKGVAVGGIAGGVGNTIQIHSVGHPRSSFYVYEQVYDENGNPLEGVYADRNGDGIINTDDKYRYESPSPDVTLGLSSRIEYKNWDASFSARANIGNYVYNNVASTNTMYSSMLNSDGYLSNALTDIKDIQFNNAQFHSDHYIENASFLRMDNVSVGYSLDGIFDQIQSMRVSATVQNAFVITNYSGLDPEVFNGIDSNIYPRPRTFILGLSLNF